MPERILRKHAALGWAQVDAVFGKHSTNVSHVSARRVDPGGLGASRFRGPDLMTCVQTRGSNLQTGGKHPSLLVHPDLLCGIAPALEFFRIRTTDPPSSNEISSISVFIR
jgi:hypothetical protein